MKVLDPENVTAGAGATEPVTAVETLSTGAAAPASGSSDWRIPFQSHFAGCKFCEV